MHQEYLSNEDFKELVDPKKDSFLLETKVEN